MTVNLYYIIYICTQGIFIWKWHRLYLSRPFQRNHELQQLRTRGFTTLWVSYELLLMAQKSCDQQLRLVVHPMIYIFFLVHPRWLALGFAKPSTVCQCFLNGGIIPNKFIISEENIWNDNLPLYLELGGADGVCPLFWSSQLPVGRYFRTRSRVIHLVVFFVRWKPSN